ncbi:Ig-like domain-containing protein [Pseudomonas sp. TH10]|uniref:Ig-like domain-containing protein n=1 Tax=Pseudomonas sp. TH10 TaxID=2796376 RepID=UPI001913574E|nr:Ig-like domain-containing protein [Pseudomonas sp. TH10]MBK5519013.1 BapA prefix-like domain-containing protein [Pseudomonas sp. TH10]
MKNIVVIDKGTGATTEQAFGNVALNGTSIVKVPISPNSVQSMQQSGKNLVITLKSGGTVTIQNFFVADSDGELNQLVLEENDGTLLLGSYSSPYSGFTFSEIGTVQELMAATAAGSTTPDWVVWGLSLLGVGAAAAIISDSNGGSGGGGGGGDADSTPPGAPTGLSFNETGAVLSGRGESGSAVTVKDAGGRVIGTGTVGTDGNFQVNLNTPQTNGETVEVTLTDPSGNVSAPGEITAGDSTAPAAATDLSVSPDGTTVSGKGEPNTTVTIKDANGNVIGTGTVGADGTFAVTLNTPQTNGESLSATLTDAAGNVSAPASVDAGDSTAPAAPTDLSVSADGTTVTGKGEPNTTVTIKDADGNVMGTGTVGTDGNFAVVLTTPHINGESLSATLTDAASNVSAPASVDAGDSTAPAAATDLSVSTDGTTVSGKGDANTTVTIKDADGNVIGTGTVGTDGNFVVTLNTPKTQGEILTTTLADTAGNESAPANVNAHNNTGGPDVTAPDAPTDLAVGADGTTVTGKGEPNTTVTIKDADGNVIGTGTVGPYGNFEAVLTTPKSTAKPSPRR